MLQSQFTALGIPLQSVLLSWSVPPETDGKADAQRSYVVPAAWGNIEHLAGTEDAVAIVGTGKVGVEGQVRVLWIHLRKVGGGRREGGREKEGEGERGGERERGRGGEGEGEGEREGRRGEGGMEGGMEESRDGGRERERTERMKEGAERRAALTWLVLVMMPLWG